uniref:Uncharacterized protein n=1 Tax=Arundo donax TaxID=35708 RepID=A0A0A9AYE9_ARUDO
MNLDTSSVINRTPRTRSPLTPTAKRLRPSYPPPWDGVASN